MEPIIVVSIVLLWIGLLFNMVLTLALVRKVNAGGGRRGQEAQIDTLKPGTPAPPFTARTLDGKTVSLASYGGQPALLLAISTHCKPCVDILPEVVAAAPNAQRAGVELLLISLDGEEDTRGFIAQHGIQLPVLLAPRESNPFHDDYKTFGTPFFYLLDDRGVIREAGFPGPGVPEWTNTLAAWQYSAPPLGGLALQEGR